MFGHIPTGPQANREIVNQAYGTHNLEPFIYICSRCIRRIRFNKNYPNGWVDEEGFHSCLNHQKL